MGRVVDKKLELLFQKGILLTYKKGEVIIRAEDDPRGIYLLKKGYVKLYNLSIDGKEQIINIFKPGSYFPIAWVLAGEKNVSYYEAITSVEAIKTPSKKVTEFLENNPESIMLLAKRFASGLSGLTKLIDILFLATARQRILYILVQFAARFGEDIGGGKIRVNLPVTHQLISSYVGLVRETVSLEMKSLRSEKIIDYSRNNLTILDLPKLEEMSELRVGEVQEI